MRIIARKTLRDFWEKHPQAEQPLRAWFAIAKKASWSTPGDIKLVFPHASVLANNRIVFNIKGNHFRLVVSIRYEFQVIYIRFIGTHAEYDRIDAAQI